MAAHLDRPHRAARRLLVPALVLIVAAGAVGCGPGATPTPGAVSPSVAPVPDAVYGPGRRAVLQPLLDRDSIYETELGRAEWEPRARDNLARELARLGPPS